MTSRIFIHILFLIASATAIALVILVSFQRQPRPFSTNSCVWGLASPKVGAEIAKECVAIAENLVHNGATEKDAYLIHMGGLFSANDLGDSHRAKNLLLKAIELGYPESYNEILVLFENNPGRYCTDMATIIQKLTNKTETQKTYRKMWKDSWTQQGCGPLPSPKNAQQLST